MPRAYSLLNFEEGVVYSCAHALRTDYCYRIRLLSACFECIVL